MTEIEALGLGAILRAKQFSLFGGFNTFGHDEHVQAAAHVDHRVHDAGVVRVGRQIAHERLIDLQGIDGKALHIGEARIPRAEVVERKQHAHVLERLEHGRGRGRIAHQEGFGQLQFQIARVQARLLQDFAHAFDEVLGAQFHRRDIDGDAHRGQPRILPGHGLAAAFAQDPSADANDHAGFFRDRDE